VSASSNSLNGGEGETKVCVVAVQRLMHSRLMHSRI
jgi:hypothetical protein